MDYRNRQDEFTDLQSSYWTMSQSLMGLDHLRKESLGGGSAGLLAYSMDDGMSHASKPSRGDAASLAYSMDDGMSRTSRRGDGASLTYSIDDGTSRASRQGGSEDLVSSRDDGVNHASGYISAASEDEHEEQALNRYYNPAMPTPVAQELGLIAPPPVFEEPKPQIGFQSLIEAPITYLFGGNESDEDADDDVSALEYGNFGEVMYSYEDDSTIATSPALRREEVEQSRILATVEEDDESRASTVDRSIISEANPMHSSFHQSYLSYASRSLRYEIQSSKEQEDARFTGTGAQSVSFSEKPEQHFYDPDHKAAEHLYETVNYHNTEQASGRLFAQQAFDVASQSNHSRSTVGMTDLDASRRHEIDDDQSLSLSQVFREEKQNVQLPRPPEPWSEQDSASIHLRRRDAEIRNSWRSMRSKATTTDPNQSVLSRSRYSSRSLGTTADTNDSSHSQFNPSMVSRRSVYSQQSVMPEVAEVMEDFSRTGGPVLTRGMSGRAVVHVRLEDDELDGSIRRLYYTTPLEDPKSTAGNEDFNDEDTIATRSDKAWLDHHHSDSELARTCCSRRCLRINAMLLLGVGLILTVVLSVATTIAETQGGGLSTTQSRQTSHLMMSLSPPSQVGNVILPQVVDTHVADWFTPRNTASEGLLPFLFHVPLSGAMIAFESWTSCLGLIVASDGGKGEVSNTTLKSSVVLGTNFVNVDVTTPGGIEHAATLGLVPSSMPDFLVSPLFQEVISKLFSFSHNARFIMIMRHPMDRAVAIYEYAKKLTNGPARQLRAMTLEEYALSGHIENNYVVRLLTGKSSGKLTVADVTFCKELLRRKAVLGVYERMGASLAHIERYLRWTPTKPNTLNCQSSVLSNGLARDTVSVLDRGSAAFALLKQQNLHDIALYDYVNNVLFPYQQEFIRQKVLQSSSVGQGINS